MILADSIELIVLDLCNELRYREEDRQYADLIQRLETLLKKKEYVSPIGCCGGTTKHEFKSGPFSKDKA